MKKIIFYLSILSLLCLGGCGQAKEDVEESAENNLEEIIEITQETDNKETIEAEEMKEESVSEETPNEIDAVEVIEKELPTPAYMKDITDEVYRNLITQLVETNHFPVCNYEADWLVYNQSYAIMDIDEDGREELILNYSNASAMAGMVYYVYDYNRTTGEVYIECAGYPDVDFLDNGYVIEEASHNHGRSDLDDFWPYHLLVYNEETDQYETVAQIDAWQKELYPKDFPDDADKDGDGIVYYTADIQFWNPTAFMDKEEYEIWCEQYNKGTAKKIQWNTIMTMEDYVAIYMQDAVG